MTRIIDRPCPLCGASTQSARTVPCGPPEWPMAECRECGMTYLTRAPDISALYQDLAWEKTRKKESKRRDHRQGWVRKLSRLTRKRLHLLPRKDPVQLIEQHAKTGHVLDVGCGSGNHLMKLSPDHTPNGIEISREIADQARDLLAERGGRIVNGDALGGMGQLKSSDFTAVIMRSFLEHDIRPLEVLTEARRLLLRDGILIIKVPNYASWNRHLRGENWCGLRFPDHVNYFTPKTLEKMVRRAGLSVYRFGLIDRLPTSDNMWLIAVKK